MPTMPPPRTEAKKLKQVQQPKVNIRDAQGLHPTTCIAEKPVMTLFRVNEKSAHNLQEISLPDYLVERGLLLFPHYGQSVRQMLDAAKKAGVEIELHLHEGNMDYLLSHTCSTGWSMMEMVPRSPDKVRTHQNGQHYNEARFADALAIVLYRVHQGRDEPFSLKDGFGCRFLVSDDSGHQRTFWITFDPGERKVSISDSSCAAPNRQLTLQQVSPL